MFLNIFLNVKSLHSAPFSSYSSGLSYEESKELIKADLHQGSNNAPPLTHQTHVAQQLEDPKCTKDSSRTADVAKDVKPARISQDLPGQKDSVSTSEPMKTRRSQHAEDCRSNTPAQSEAAPAPKTPEAEKQNEQDSACTRPEEEHEEDTKERNNELPESTIKTSPPLKGSSESKEDQLVSVLKPSVGSEDVTSEPSGPSEAPKRKSLSETENELTPEKRSRLSSVSSVSSASPSASSISSPATPSPTNQRVPPLKVGIHLGT